MTKRFLILLSALAAVCCSPQVYTMHLDVREASSSGFNLAKKTIAVVYMEDPDGADSLFRSNVTSYFVRALEDDYFGGEEMIPIYAIPKRDTVDVQFMRDLIMDSNRDVVFLMNSTLGTPVLDSLHAVEGATSVDSAFFCSAAIPLSASIYVYDSMAVDSVTTYTGSRIMHRKVFTSGLVPEEYVADDAMKDASAKWGVQAGNAFAARFLSQWTTRGFSFYYFDTFDPEPWLLALDKAREMDFTGAIRIWSGFLDDANHRKRAVAAYNIAMSCYLMDRRELASQWLDLADSYAGLPLSPGLRARIAGTAK